MTKLTTRRYDSLQDHQGQELRAEEKLEANCKQEGMFSYRHLEVETNGDVIVVRLGKHRVLDELTADKISDGLFGVADRPDCNRLLFDFSGVAQLSSAMLAKLIRLHKKMAAKGQKLRLCGISSQLRSVFATTMLDRLFDITDTEANALKAITHQSSLHGKGTLTMDIRRASTRSTADVESSVKAVCSVLYNTRSPKIMKMFFTGKGESIVINDEITITVIDIDSDEVTLAIEAHRAVEIDGNEPIRSEDDLKEWRPLQPR